MQVGGCPDELKVEFDLHDIAQHSAEWAEAEVEVPAVNGDLSRVDIGLPVVQRSTSSAWISGWSVSWSMNQFGWTGASGVAARFCQQPRQRDLRDARVVPAGDGAQAFHQGEAVLLGKGQEVEAGVAIVRIR